MRIDKCLLAQYIVVLLLFLWTLRIFYFVYYLEPESYYTTAEEEY